MDIALKTGKHSNLIDWFYATSAGFIQIRKLRFLRFLFGHIKYENANLKLV